MKAFRVECDILAHNLQGLVFLRNRRTLPKTTLLPSLSNESLNSVIIILTYIVRFKWSIKFKYYDMHLTCTAVDSA